MLFIQIICNNFWYIYNYNQYVSATQPCISAAIPLPPPSTYSTTAPLSLPCPTSIEHSSQPSRDYRSDDHDDLIRRLEDEKYRFVELFKVIWVLIIGTYL